MRAIHAGLLSVITILVVVVACGCPDESDEYAAHYFEERLDRRRVDPPSLPASPKVLLLDAKPCGELRTMGGNGLLGREIFRQALLMSARSHFNLVTRDVVLEESAETVSEAQVAALGMRVAVWHWMPGSVEILPGDSDGFFWRKAIVSDRAPRYPTLVGQAVAFAQEDYPALLERIGLKPQTRAAAPVGGSTVSADELYRMSCFAQYCILREAEAELRSGGSSPAVFERLIRGYSNLGELAQHWWREAHKVFKARALLYAEQYVRSAPESIHALALRAYAYALVGLHADALREMETLHSRSTPESLPKWCEIAEAYCRYDYAALQDLAGSPDPSGELAAYLYLVALEPEQSDLPIIRAARAILQRNPGCFRAWDLLCDYDDPTALAGDVQSAAEAYAGLLEELATRGVLPSSAAERLRSQGERLCSEFPIPVGHGDLIHALRSLSPADDDCEPSLAVLGLMCEETAFQLAYHRTCGLRSNKIAEATKLVDAMIVLFPDHPFNCVLRGSVMEEAEAPQEYAEVCSGFSGRDVALRTMNRVNWMWPHNEKACVIGTAPTSRNPFVQADNIAHDCYEIYWRPVGEPMWTLALSWSQISPRCPSARAALIWHRWRQAEPNIADWLAEHPQSSVLWSSLATHYAADGRSEDSLAANLRALELNPSAAFYNVVADQYVTLGRHDEAVALVQRYLTGPDATPSGSRQLRFWLANHALRQGDYAQAVEIGDAMVQEGQPFGRLYTADGCIGLGDRARALQEMTALSAERGFERYAFFWMVRCGYGDLDEVAKRVEAWIDFRQRATELHEGREWAAFRELRGDTRSAWRLYTDFGERWRDAESSMRCAIMADRLGEREMRTRALGNVQRCCANARGQTGVMGAMEKVNNRYMDLLSPFRHEGLTGKFVDEVLAQCAGQPDEADVKYAIGFLQTRYGNRAQGLALLQECVQNPSFPEELRALAAARVRETEEAIRKSAESVEN